MQGIYCLAQDLLASQEGLCSMDLVSYWVGYLVFHSSVYSASMECMGFSI
jgi:hypothetical protein